MIFSDVNLDTEVSTVEERELKKVFYKLSLKFNPDNESIPNKLLFTNKQEQEQQQQTTQSLNSQKRSNTTHF